VHLLAKTIQKMMTSHQSFTTQDVRLLHKKATTSFNHRNVNLTSQFSNCWFIIVNKAMKGQNPMIWIIFYQHATTFTTILSHIDK